MNRLNHHHLFIFWTLARTGTFTNAARELSIAQSAVTSQIKQLESALGLTLIDRENRRNPELTSEGRRVLEFADSIFEASQELLKWATRGEAPQASVIRVGAISGLSRNFQYEFLKPALESRLTKVDVRIGDQEQLLRLLKEHSLDVVLSSRNVTSDGRVSLYSHVLTSSAVVFVTGNQQARKFKSLSDALTRLPLYLPGLSFEIRPELDAYLEGLKAPVRIAGEIEDIALLRILALRANAVIAIPEMGVKNEIAEGSIKVIPNSSRIEQRFYAITRQKRVPHRTVDELIREMKK